MKCKRCHRSNPDEHLFCSCCGGSLMAAGTLRKGTTGIHCERKTITVVFTDLVGYTTMSECLDPEEVKDIMGQVFGEIKNVVAQYDGYIEKVIGDAAMILFGVPISHEDDPVRATRAALEIHQRVTSLRHHFCNRAGHPLTMHTGVNTGLVVIDKIHSIHETQGFTGDAINLAARLASVAGAGEILVGADTYALAKGFFHFEPLPPTWVKGKPQPVDAYRVLSLRISPQKYLGRLDVSSELIGRSNELVRLKRAADRLANGQGAVITVCGDAGTGKSRLVEEFKNALNPHRFRWLAGNAFTHSQHVPYALVLNFFIQLARIEEGDLPQTIHRKINACLSVVVNQPGTVIPYVEKLFALSETDCDISPDIWKDRFKTAYCSVLQGLSRIRPTIICLEDLHWADASSLALICSVLPHCTYPLLFICVHRPEMTLIDRRLRAILNGHLIELRLGPLSADQTQDMLKSLLNVDHLSDGLDRFIESKVDGNPFYLEEVVRSLVESNVLVRVRDRWRLNRSVVDVNIPLTIQGVISGRLDRLEPEHKLVLREASVIGRSFIYNILAHITQLDHRIDECLANLLDHDLIKMQVDGSDMAYVFKHALTQEVVYKGLLKRERRDIHERIGLMIEQIYADRLPEFFESLAYHFKHGRSVNKAIAYLAKSGEKSLKRYALEEAHHYYQEAYELIRRQSPKTTSTDKCLLDLLNGWSFVYYYRGQYRQLLRLLAAHKDLAESMSDKRRLGPFYAWMGCALWHRERFKEAHDYLQAALDLAKQCHDPVTIGYARCWMAWICTELGSIPAAVDHAQKAQHLFTTYRIDSYIFINSLAGMGYAFWHSGNPHKTKTIGQKLLRYGKDKSDSRSQVMGYCCLGWSQLIEGDIDRATRYFEKAVQRSMDPWYSVFPKLALCYGHIAFGEIQRAEQLIQELLDFSRVRGAEFVGNPTRFFKGVVYVTKGDIRRGMRLLRQQLDHWDRAGSRLRFASCGYIYASINARLVRHVLSVKYGRPIHRLTLLLKGVSSAVGKVSRLFELVIAAADGMDAKGVLGKAYLEWGLLHHARGRMEKAEQCFRTALTYFEQCHAEGLSCEAQNALASLRGHQNPV